MNTIPIATKNLSSTHVRYVEVADYRALPFGCQFAFEVDIANGRKAYLKFGDGYDDISNGCSGYDVVLVQADKFLQLWKNYRDAFWEYHRIEHERNRPRDIVSRFKVMLGRSTYDSDFNEEWAAKADISSPSYEYTHQLAYENEANWRRFRKFPDAEQGFAWGIKNPVRLPLVGCNPENSSTATVGFTNGVTRTIWLMANGAKEIPVSCERGSGSELLHRHAGADGVAGIFRKDRK